MKHAVCTIIMVLTLSVTIIIPAAQAADSHGPSASLSHLPLLHPGAPLPATRTKGGIKHTDGIEALIQPPLLFERPELGENPDWTFVSPNRAAVYEYNPQTNTLTTVTFCPGSYDATDAGRHGAGARMAAGCG